MSCPDELTWSIYVDGELDGEALRKSELHLVACVDCRMQVVALQEEAQALAAAVLERPAYRAAAPEAAPPARDLAWGLPLAVVAVTGVLAIGGALVEARLPGVFDLLNPRRLMGAYELAFDSIFLLREQLPGFIELVTAVGIVTAVSALGCALVHALSQRLLKSSSLMIVAALALLGADPARAVDLRTEEDATIVIGADETVDETLVCAGDVVTIDGKVNGDLVALAERVSIRGQVTGNVIAFGDEVEIDGEVGGTVIAAGGTARLAARVAGSVLIGGERITIARGAVVERDATFLGEGVQLDGTVERDVTFGGEWIELRGAVARDLHTLYAERVSLLDGARIGRDLRAHVRDGPEAVDRAPGAEVAGNVDIQTENLVHEHYLSRYGEPGFYVRVLIVAAAAFLFGLLVYVLDPRIFDAETPDAGGFFRSLGVGFVVCIAGPFVILFAGLTVVGIPIAVFGFFLFLLSLYTGTILVAGMIGRAIVTPSGSGLGGFAPSFLVGVSILMVAAIIPFVGAAVRIITVLFGLGCLIDRVRGVHALNVRSLRANV